MTFEGTQQDRYDIAETLWASDLITTMASTMTLDSAALDRPIINIAFDGFKNESFFRSLRKNLDYTHYRKIIPSQAFRIVYDSQELEKEMIQYLKDPKRDSQQRKNLTKMVTGELDGLASRHIAGFLLDCLFPHEPHNVMNQKDELI